MPRTLAMHGGSPAFPAGAPAWPLPDEAITEAISKAMRDGSWGNYFGPAQEQLVAELQSRFQATCAYPVCSGTFATELALRMLKIEPGDEVLLAAYDFAGNFRAIEAVGARPVLCDVQAKSWTIDLEQFKQAARSSVKAVIVSHLHGELAPMREIMQLAAKFGWKVVEDTCQAPGAMVDGRVAGSWGDVGTHSFGGSKLLTAGRGGAVVTNHVQLYQRAKVICEQGNHAYPLSELQAIVLLPQLAKLKVRNEQRARAVNRLIKSIREGESTAELLSSAGALPFQELQNQPAYYKRGWRVHHAELRDSLAQALQAEGIAIDAGFRGFAARSGSRCRKLGDLPNATQAAAGTLVLHHPILLANDETLDRLANTFVEVAGHFSENQGS